ncbi:MAG TPA: SDR family oxidoreductase [Cerasibacillus sp.]|uniref:elongation factor P 5-aminopentanone reductase n=1 Tax=Cerasibacillus sp. TaxID=2498711 RepID=UPI002F3F796D
MGKNVLIIGASGDIGKHIAINLGEAGHQLILHYNQNDAAIEEIKSLLPDETILSVIQADLQTTKHIQVFIKQVVFSVDAIVFACGNAHYSLFQDTSEQTMDTLIQLHIKAPWLICQAFLPEMIERRSGHIIMITSVWGEVGASYEVAYSSVKGAQISFIKALAKEVGSSHVLVNGVSPGWIDTKMNDLSKEEREKLKMEIPLQRPGSPNDVSDLVHFLLSDKANYIHGQIIRVDGGWQ